MFAAGGCPQWMELSVLAGAVELLPSVAEERLGEAVGQESVLSLSIFPLASPSLKDAKQPFSLLVSVVLRKSSQRAGSRKRSLPCLERLPKPAGGCWPALDVSG